MELWALGPDGKTPLLLEEGEQPDAKQSHRVARDVLPNGKVVSTVFLCVDHSHDGGPPVLFETMVFPSEEDFGDIDGDRYTDWDLAVAGHNLLVKKHS